MWLDQLTQDLRYACRGMRRVRRPRSDVSERPRGAGRAGASARGNPRRRPPCGHRGGNERESALLSEEHPRGGAGGWNVGEADTSRVVSPEFFSLLHIPTRRYVV